MSEIQLALFTLNNEVCGADTVQVQEIVKYQDTARKEGMSDLIEGTINLRDQNIPVVDLNKRFGLGNTEKTRNTKIIITCIDKRLVGFTVNEVLGIERFSEAEVEAAPAIISKAGSVCIKCVGKKGGMIISILDMNNILDIHELEQLMGT